MEGFFTIKRSGSGLLALIFTLLLCLTSARADVILDEDVRTDLLIMPSDLQSLTPEQLEAWIKARGRWLEELKPAELRRLKRRVKRIELVRVIPRRGNNPLNTREPIKNTFIDGQVVFRAVDEVEKEVEPTPEPTPSTCTPASYTHSDTIVFYLNPTANTCVLAPSGPPPGGGTTEAFDVTNPAKGFAPAGTIFVQTNPAIDFRFTQVPPGATVSTPGISWTVPSGNTGNWVLRQTSTGKQWMLNMTVQGTGTHPDWNFNTVTLTVNSVTPL